MTIRLRYRISIQSRLIFVRELIHGEVVGRISTERETLRLSEMAAVVAECKHLFEGAIVTFRFDGNAVEVACNIIVENEVI